LSALYQTPTYVIALVTMAFVGCALELGHRIGHFFPHDEYQVTRLSAPMMAIVGLLLAFSFSMATERLGLRFHATVQAANSIGTFWLRTALVSSPRRGEMRARVRRYVDLHFEHRAAGLDQQKMAALEAEAARLQSELWSLVVEEAQGSTDNRTAVLLVAPALNAMIDDGASLLAAKDHRLPDSVVLLLLSLVIIAAFVAGYGARRERRALVLWGALIIILGGVLAVLLDMDRPRYGWIQSTTEPFERVRAIVYTTGP
jgi:hypothetical protein